MSPSRLLLQGVHCEAANIAVRHQLNHSAVNCPAPHFSKIARSGAPSLFSLSKLTTKGVILRQPTLVVACSTVRTNPKLTEIPRYPVVAGTALLAIGVTVAWWSKVDISPLFETAMIRRGELWRMTI